MGKKKGNKSQPQPDGSQPAPSQTTNQPRRDEASQIPQSSGPPVGPSQGAAAPIGPPATVGGPRPQIGQFGPPLKPAFSRKDDSAPPKDKSQTKPITTGVKPATPVESVPASSTVEKGVEPKPTPTKEPALPTSEDSAPKTGRKKGKGKKDAVSDEPKPAISKPPLEKNGADGQPKAPPPKETLSEEKPTSTIPEQLASKAAGKKKGKGKKGPADEPQQPGKKDPASDKPKPSPSSITKGIEELDIGEFPTPVRKARQIVHTPKYMAKKFRVEVNHLRVDIKKSNLKIYHYDVEFNPNACRFLFRRALQMFLDQHAPGRHPAFDRRKNLYAAGSPLPFGKEVTSEHTLLNHETGKDITYTITVKLVDQELNMSSLWDYLDHGRSANLPQDLLQALDIAIREPLTLGRFVQVGRSFFSDPNNFIDLSGGLELWPGQFQSVVLGWKPYLNVDVAHKAFYTSQSLIELLKQIMPRNFDLSRPLMDRQKEELRKAIVTFKFEYQMPNNPAVRKYRIVGVGGPADQETFSYEENGVTRQITVAEYFRRVRGYRLRYPNLPVIKTQKGNLFPLELCKMAANQPLVRKLNSNQTSEMVKNAAQPPDIRKQRILPNIRNAGYNGSACVQEFGITIDDRFQEVDAWVLHPPSIEYANKNVAKVNNGVWRINGRFFTSMTLNNWAIINLEQRGIDDRNIRSLVQEFRRVGSSLGMNINEPSYVNGYLNMRSEKDLINEFSRFAKNRPDIVVVIMNNSDDCYGRIKRAAELQAGILTQCLKSKTAQRMNAMTAINILLKVNAKLNGTNHILLNTTCPPILREQPVMIVGADVTHPSPGVDSVSIAAVASSHDVHGFKYNMTYRLQTSRTEMIYDLKDMIKEQLKLYRQQTGKIPAKILYYRDGVSEGQFAQVKHVELTAIRAACTELSASYQPGITFMVVQKRHHTRFFPPANSDCSDKNNNVIAGTVVDQEITHPTEMDFYMVSHESIKGTARPTKYHLLWDDNNFDMEPLEQLTYYLCHMFARCTRSVSYPAPTYYAHLAAFRARAWWERVNFDPAILNDAAALRNFQNQNGTITLNSPMFFV